MVSERSKGWNRSEFWLINIIVLLPASNRCLCYLPTRSYNGDGKPIVNDSSITGILNDLVNENVYDRRLRPNYGGKPVEVGITLRVSSISAVSEVDMNFTLDFYIRQFWKDPRLSFHHELNRSEDLTVGFDYVKKLWVPDTFFPNEKSSFFHHATTRNSFLRIKKDGDVMISQRLTVTATCHMKLHLFPLDSQKCSLELESCKMLYSVLKQHHTVEGITDYNCGTSNNKTNSDGYLISDVVLAWKKEVVNGTRKNPVALAKVELPQFSLSQFATGQKKVQTNTGFYMRLVCQFLFTRSLGFYIIQIYLPSMLIVVISWVSFWLSRDATPARVSLGVTTVLTMTTLMTTTNSAMPKVSYIKAIDIYLGTCFLMVFASLLEYAAVGYLSKRMKMQSHKTYDRSIFREQLEEQAITMPAVRYSKPPIQAQRPRSFINKMSFKSHKARAARSELELTEKVLPTNRQSHPARSGFHITEDVRTTHTIFQMQLTRPTRSKDYRVSYSGSETSDRRLNISSSEIDKHSRSFTAFNAIYWLVFYNIGEHMLQVNDVITNVTKL